MSEEAGYAHRAGGGIAWMTAQKWFSRIVGLLTVVILTRLLTPTDFGLVAVALSVIPFVYLLADLGFSTYLVQAEQPDKRDFSTAFWYSAGAGIVLAFMLGGLGAPLEWLLHAPGVAPVMWGLAPAVVCVALGAVPTAILRRSMRFRAVALQSFAGGAIGQIVAVVLAFLGLGVWALVFQTVVTQLVTTALAWASARWAPSWDFSVAEFRRMLRYGGNVVAVEVVALSRAGAENAIVAATLGVAGLGYLSIAQRLIQVGQDLTATAITPVSTVVFAQIRGSLERLARAYARAQALIYLLVIPVMVVVVIDAPQLVILVFGSQWEPSVAPAQALAVAAILTVGASLDNGLFYGLGKPGIWLGYAIAIDSLTVLTTWILAPRGLAAIALGFVGVALVATFVRWPLVGRQLALRWWELAIPFLRASVIGLIIGTAGWLFGRVTTGIPDIFGLALLGVVVFVAWLLASRLLLPDATVELWRMANSVVRRLRGSRRGNGNARSEGA